MKQLLDFIPLILFFATFKLLGIFPATAILIVASLCLYGYIWFRDGKLERNHIIILVITLIAGGMTLYFHDVTFLKWKASIVYWLIGSFFLGSHFYGNQLAVQRLMGQAMELPATVWTRLNIAWTVFFFGMGALSLYIAFHFSTDIWVDFKSIGSLGLTFLFVIGQMFFIHPYLPAETPKEPKD
jgi:intracellular septation protein